MPNKAIQPVVLIVRDGWGCSPKKQGNAIAHAHAENAQRYEKEYPTTLLEASGNAVGLPNGTQGTSEVGHLTMGAGRIVWQPLELINLAINDNSFEENKVLSKAVQQSRNNKTALHITGLLSDGNVHAAMEHLFALLNLARKLNHQRIFIHPILDGRDVAERSTLKYLTQLQEHLNKLKMGKIASLVGRYYAMDRDNNLDRTEKAFKLLTEGQGITEEYYETAILNAYERGDATDYYIQPIVLTENKKPITTIKGNDTLIFYNFRTDRARQLTKMFIEKKPTVKLVCFTEYDPTFKVPIAFPQEKVANNLGQVLAMHNKKQVRIAETEKYAHVTYFFNSQVETPNNGEERVLIPSKKVKSYEEAPEMSAEEITKKAVNAIKTEKYDFILINFANPDLVGHSGNFEATKKGCKVVDECVEKIVSAALKKAGVVLLTADHGNAEQMQYANGERCPSHTTNPVPCSLISKEKQLRRVELKENKGLKDIAPTILKLLNLNKPKEMTGEALF